MKTRIREQRKAAGLTLVQLSERAGISVSYLSEIETGDKTVNIRRIEQIAKALGCEPAQLLSDDAEGRRAGQIISELSGLPDEDWEAVLEYAMLRKSAREKAD